MIDALVLSQQIAPYVTAAVASYGTAVLTRSAELSVDSTVSLGQRLLDKLLRRSSAQEAAEENALASAIEDLSDNPEDSDLQAALRVQLKKLLLSDPQMISEISEIMDQSGISIVASGDRAVAAYTINGGVSTGDQHS
ncbi:hypothetical protein ACSCB1_44290 [Streptomyces europaeiscabiei]|uniref:hypothetical protein n=1 Tax=Streptomyces europaeiscabiei TaxID=146819 RepID=UPI00131B94B3|nr:hypothetical protein [Streptomyces europaeiscabiei]